MTERKFIREYVSNGNKYLEFTDGLYIQKSYYNSNTGARGTWLEKV